MHDPFSPAKDLSIFGPQHTLAYACWTPTTGSWQTLTDAHGVSRVFRSGSGTWAVELEEKGGAVASWFGVRATDLATAWHANYVSETRNTTQPPTVYLITRRWLYSSPSIPTDAETGVGEVYFFAIVRTGT